MSFPSQSFRRFVLRRLGMKIGKGSVIFMGTEIRAPWKIIIGDGTTIGHNCVLDGRGELEIGNNVNLSSDVMIWTQEHDMNSPNFVITSGKVKVEDYAWLSCRVIVLPGVTIGRGAVVAAGAVVTKSVEPFTIVAGVPAKQVGIRSRDLHYTCGRGGLWLV